MAETSNNDPMLDLYQDIVRKLDTVILGQSDLKSNQARLEANQEALAETLDEVKADVTEITHTVRGHNGTPGLVAEVAVIKQSLEHYRKDCDDDQAEGDKDRETAEKSFLSKDWLLDKFTYVALAMFVFFILEFMPQLFGHLAEAVSVATPVP